MICDVCTNIPLEDLLYQATPRNPTPQDHRLQYQAEDTVLNNLKVTILVLDDAFQIRSRRESCELCAIVAEALDRLPDPEKGACFARGRVAFGQQLARGHRNEPSDFATRIQIVHSSQSVDRVCDAAPRSFDQQGFQYSELTSLLELQLGSDPLPATINNVFSVNGGQDYTFRARRVNPDFVDVKLIRKWLDNCQEEHGACRAGHSSLPVNNDGFFLIDVEEKCVYDNIDAEVIFAALSYCWGDAPNQPRPLHVKANSEELRTPGALNGEAVSKTIADAISLTSSLGIPYLWVDSICLVQDDPAQQLQQIQNMDAIYSSAVLTIIAASGSHSNFGLPGMRPGTRDSASSGQKVVKIRDRSLVTVLDWRIPGYVGSSP